MQAIAEIPTVKRFLLDQPTRAPRKPRRSRWVPWATVSLLGAALGLLGLILIALLAGCDGCPGFEGPRAPDAPPAARVDATPADAAPEVTAGPCEPIIEGPDFSLMLVGTL